jgi:DnaJ-class molecular chaperone
VQDKKILEVNVERGMQHNQKIVFRGEADEAVRGRPARVRTQPRTHALARPLHSRTRSRATLFSSFSRRSTRSSSARVRARRAALPSVRA